MRRADMAGIAAEQRSTLEGPERREVARPRHLGEFMRAARPARIAPSVAPESAGGHVYRFGG